MITRYKHKTTIPYSLHDMIVTGISYDNDSITFSFDEGYEQLVEPYNKVKGNISIYGVDFDFVSFLLLTSNKKNDMSGKRLSIEEFVAQYKSFSFEIVDELYGYNKVQYSGYLSIPESDGFIEITVDVYHFGDIVYETIE